MNVQIPNQKQPNEESQRPQLGISWFWWILLIGLVIWNAITYLSVEPSKVEIPYSTFLDQVKTGNISAVTITGNEITGEFIKPLSWPPAAIRSSSTTSTQSYPEFDTRFPESVGDPNLLALLEEKNIEIQVQDVSTP